MKTKKNIDNDKIPILIKYILWIALILYGIGLLLGGYGFFRKNFPLH